MKLEPARLLLVGPQPNQRGDGFRSAIEAAPNPLILVDRGGAIVLANGQSERTFGYRRDELLGQSISVLVPERYREGHGDLVAGYMQNPQMRPIGVGRDLFARCKDGREIPVEIGLNPIETSEGRFVLASIVDIRERKRAEAELREKAKLAALAADIGIAQTRNAPLEEILRSCTDAVVHQLEAAFARIWILNPKSRVLELRASSGLYTHLDGAHSRIELGQLKIGRIAQQRRPHLTNAVARDPWISDPPWAGREGMESFAGYPLIVDDELLGVLAMFSRKPLTEFVVHALGSIASTIALGIRRKRAELQQAELQQQLLQSQKMEAIGQLAGGVAHDFNNLLSVIIGYSDLILPRLEAQDPVCAYVAEIRRAGDRAAALTRQLLAFSRKQMLDLRVLNLNRVIRETDKMLRRIIGEDIELKLLLDPALDHIKADSSQMEQIIMNLVVNARDAMPRGGRLTIETANAELDRGYADTHPEVQPGPYVMISISDTGHGMSKQVQSKIFEPFFTTKRLGKGTGLGLATVYGIVKQSKGSIWLYSEPRKGTTFKIYLPRAQSPAADPMRPALPPESLRGSETILIAEDEPNVRQLAATILRENGYTVLLAEDPESALELCRSRGQHIDLLLTDVIMPRMSGPELSERVRAAQPHIRILFMSGYTEDTVAQDQMMQSGSGFIPKPFTPTLLLQKLRQAFER